jgi:BirA family biotin operon repressor/biotin-[acetyl-CoA-carboxylase] ligase
MIDEPLTPETILDNLGTALLPRRVLCYEQVSSTMDVAREQLQQLPPDAFPLLVLADEQTAGRGRMRRPWATSPGSALLFSLVLRPRWLAPESSMALVWMAAVSLCEAISLVTPLHPRLKWPNDVLLPADPPVPGGAWHKVAGILLESGYAQQRLEWASIGCGINISEHPPADLLRSPATDLSAALGEPMPRLPLLRAALLRLDTWYARLQQGDYDGLFAAWRSLLITLGRPVEIETAAGEILRGRAEDVEPSGALRIRDAAGTLHTISSGDVCV